MSRASDRISPAGPPGGRGRPSPALAAIAVLSGVILLAACGAATEPPTTGEGGTTAPQASPLVVEGPGRYEGEIVSTGLLRRFVLVVPRAAPRPTPLVIVLHGLMGSPRELERDTGMTEVAEREGFAVVYPEGQGLPRSWRSDPRRGDLDVTFIRDLVALLSRAYDFDERRVFAAGMSNGGGMAARLACEASDVVAAVGGVAGAYFLGNCGPLRPVPIIAFHGDADPIVPYEGWGPFLPPIEEWAGQWAARNGCNAEAEAEPVAADATVYRWQDCSDQADVVLYKIADGRHGWPGSSRAGEYLGTTDSLYASQLIWDFFAAHPMP